MCIRDRCSTECLNPGREFIHDVLRGLRVQTRHLGVIISADGKLIFTNFMPTCGVNGVKVKVNQEKQHYSRNRARNSSTNGFTRSGASSCGQWPTSENARTSSTASNRRSASTRFGGVQGSLPP